MPLFVCDKCKCVENTALSNFWGREKDEPALCSECDPTITKWHGHFEKVVYDPVKHKDWDFYYKGT